MIILIPAALVSFLVAVMLTMATDNQTTDRVNANAIVGETLSIHHRDLIDAAATTSGFAGHSGNRVFSPRDPVLTYRHVNSTEVVYITWPASLSGAVTNGSAPDPEVVRRALQDFAQASILLNANSDVPGVTTVGVIGNPVSGASGSGTFQIPFNTQAAGINIPRGAPIMMTRISKLPEA